MGLQDVAGKYVLQHKKYVSKIIWKIGRSGITLHSLLRTRATDIERITIDKK